jgi:capsular polysaccharide biosynthesis protein
MTYTTIIYSRDGIDIDYNANEKNKEIVFFLDDHNRIIQNRTFDCVIYPNPSQFDSFIREAESKDTVYLENGFLFYSYRYQISFVHYMTQNVPKLYDYIHSHMADTKLLIPKYEYNRLCRNILDLVGIPETNIILLEDSTFYRIGRFVTSVKYVAPPGSFTKSHVEIYNMIRRPLCIQPSTKQRLIYLQRDGVPSPEFNNSETGSKRVMFNEPEFVEKLRSIEFEIVTLGDKTIEQKHQLLSNAYIIITPLGANAFNLVFTNAPTHVIFLSNDRNFGENYYPCLSEVLNSEKIQTRTFRYPSVDTDPLNYWNASFTINIDEIINYIKTICTR